MKKTITFILIGVAIGIIVMKMLEIKEIKKIEKQNVLYDVVVTRQFINVRTQPTVKAKKVYEVVKNESYGVIETFSDGTYNWYKIIYLNRRVGWIANSVEDEWLKEVK